MSLKCGTPPPAYQSQLFDAPRWTPVAAPAPSCRPSKVSAGALYRRRFPSEVARPRLLEFITAFVSSPLSCGQPLIFKEASPLLSPAPRHFVTGALGIVTKVLHMISGQPTEEEEKKNVPACFSLMPPLPPPASPSAPAPASSSSAKCRSAVH